MYTCCRVPWLDHTEQLEVEFCVCQMGHIYKQNIPKLQHALCSRHLNNIIILLIALSYFCSKQCMTANSIGVEVLPYDRDINIVPSVLYSRIKDLPGRVELTVP